MKIVAITQARSGSSRLPGKVLKTIQGSTLLEIHLNRIAKSTKIDKLIVATTKKKQDQQIEDLCKKIGVEVFRGSENNVLDRFYKAVQSEDPDWVVRLTSDCPLIDAKLIDEIIGKAVENDLDYTSNCLNPTYPDGQDVEVFKYKNLVKAWQEATSTVDIEHVTPYLWRNSDAKNGSLFKALSVEHDPSYEKVRMTVDENVDFQVIECLVKDLGTESDWKTYADYILSNDPIKNLNAGITRNEGFTKSQENANE